MEILKAILFGIVEGITEWLPISSSKFGFLFLVAMGHRKIQSEEAYSQIADA